MCIERQQHDSGFLLVSQGVVIVRVPLNGKNVRPISVASMAIGLDKDCVAGRIYWGDISTKKIISAKYDGTDVKPFITEGEFKNALLFCLKQIFGHVFYLYHRR